MKRTPKFYDGTGKTAKTLGELLPEVFKTVKNPSGDFRDEEVFRYWNTLGGESMAPMTEPISLVGGVLTVKVKSSTLYSLLRGVERARLENELREKFQIRGLVFRPG
jgi:hypothetical protein